MNAESKIIGDQQTVDLQDCVLLGKLVGVWGVKGWLKVFSYTRPRQDIGQYKRWLLIPTLPLKKTSKKKQTTACKAVANVVSVRNCRLQGQNIVAQIDGINYRDQAEAMFGYEVYIEKNQLKPLQDGEFYWSDMIGCTVTNQEGDKLGSVESMIETGANDVLVVHGSNTDLSLDQNKGSSEIVEHLIPYSSEIVLSVNTDEKQILVDWGIDFLVTEKSTDLKKPKLTKQQRAEEIRLAKLEKMKNQGDDPSNSSNSV